MTDGRSDDDELKDLDSFDDLVDDLAIDKHTSEVSGGGLSAGDLGSNAGIVTARGTGDGLVIRLDGRVARETLLDALKAFVKSREGFLKGHEVALEWVGKTPNDIVVEEVSRFLKDDFRITVTGSSSGRRSGFLEEVKQTPAAESKSVSLFGGLEAFSMDEEISAMGSMPKSSGRAEAAISEAAIWDDPNARLVFSTLRSGQKIETEHSLVVCGDINSGAELIAGGDIIVLGTLRGVAHAGAYDETGGGSFIFALNLHPTQLRIGSVISRGPAEGGGVPEIARVDGDIIIVEAYQARSRLLKKADSVRNELHSI